MPVRRLDKYMYGNELLPRLSNKLSRMWMNGNVPSLVVAVAMPAIFSRFKYFPCHVAISWQIAVASLFIAG